MNELEVNLPVADESNDKTEDNPKYIRNFDLQIICQFLLHNIYNMTKIIYRI